MTRGLDEMAGQVVHQMMRSHAGAMRIERQVTLVSLVMTGAKRDGSVLEKEVVL